MRGEHRFQVAMAAVILIGCHTHSTYAQPALPPPPPGPVYLSSSAEAESQGAVVGAADDGYQDNDPSALEDFRGPLGGHGAWVDDTEYGTVWVPASEEVGPDFVPYSTAGHWVYDDDDYVWVSDYPWGWVPFHYGRWVLIVGRGWAWIPGRVYAGAWVTWRIGAADFGYVGWAPMPPLWIWRNRIAVGVAIAPPAHYIFCQRREIFAPRVSERIIRGPSVVGIERRTQVYVAPPAHAAGGHVVARPAHPGPPPSVLRIDPSRVTRLTPRDQGVYTARRYAVPSTARPLGARAPAPQLAPPRPSQPSGSRFPLGAAAPQPPSPAQRPQPPQRPVTPLPRVSPPARTAPPQALPRAPGRIPTPDASPRVPRVAPRPVPPAPATPPRAPSTPRVPQRAPSPQPVRPAPRLQR